MEPEVSRVLECWFLLRSAVFKFLSNLLCYCCRSTMPCKCTDGTRGEYGYGTDGLLIPRLASNVCIMGHIFSCF